MDVRQIIALAAIILLLALHFSVGQVSSRPSIESRLETIQQEHYRMMGELVAVKGQTADIVNRLSGHESLQNSERMPQRLSTLEAMMQATDAKVTEGLWISRTMVGALIIAIIQQLYERRKRRA